MLACGVSEMSAVVRCIVCDGPAVVAATEIPGSVVCEKKAAAFCGGCLRRAVSDAIRVAEEAEEIASERREFARVLGGAGGVWGEGRPG